MLNILNEAIKQLPELIRLNDWNSLYIDYEEPFVERLWRNYGDYRLYLHKIYPCKGKPYLHTHPWPSAIKIISGAYRMETAYLDDNDVRQPVATIILSDSDEYEMLSKYGMHSVNPINGPSYSVMLTGDVWKDRNFKSFKAYNLRSLSEIEKSDLINKFKQFFPLESNL